MFILCTTYSNTDFWNFEVYFVNTRHLDFSQHLKGVHPLANIGFSNESPTTYCNENRKSEDFSQNI